MKSSLKYILLALAAIAFCFIGYGFGKITSMGTDDEPVETEVVTAIATENDANQVVEDEPEEEKLDVTDVAVVNLDEGADYKSEKVYYAQQILDFSEADGFKYTSLSDAMSGLDNGTYGAYIVIPADFSSNVLSINDSPAVSKIEYTLSDMITDTSKYETLLKITNLSNDLDNDLSYMYLESLMTEIHEVQDNAEEVMDNDKDDKDIIDKIKAADLISLVEIPKMKDVKKDTKDIDSDKYNDSNEKLVKDMDKKYADLIDEAEGTLKKADKQKETLQKELDKDLKETEKIDFFKDENGNDIKKEAGNKLDQEMTSFKNQTDKNKQEINNKAKKVSEKAGKIDSTFKKELHSATDALEANNKSVKELKDYIPDIIFEQGDNKDKYYITCDSEGVKAARKQYNVDVDTDVPSEEIATKKTITDERTLVLKTVLKKIDDYLDTFDFSATPTDPVTEPTFDGLIEYCCTKKVFSGKYADADADKIKEVINSDKTGCYDTWELNEQFVDKDNDFNKFMSEEVKAYTENSLYDKNAFDQTNASLKDVNNSVNDINKAAEESFSDINTNGIRSVFDDYYIKKIGQNSENVKDAYTKKYDSALKGLQVFGNGINKLKFSTDTGFASEYTSKISENNTNLATDAMDSNGSYMDYASNLVDANSENMDAVRKNVEKANEQAKKTIEDSLADVKNKKAINSERNQDILVEITKKLTYTRIGSLENKKAYEFIAEPVVVTGEAIQRTEKEAKVKKTTDQLVKQTVVGKEVTPQSKTTKSAKNIIIGMVVALMTLIVIIILLVKIMGQKKGTWE